MATYPEPIELVPEFDSTNFPINTSSSAQGGGVDVAKLNFPIAQGSESFPFGLASDAQLSLTSTSGQSTLEQLPSLLKIQNLENGGITNFYNDTALGVQTNPLSINSSGITIIQGTVSNPPVNPNDIATKDYVDSNSSNILNTANIWTNTNTFSNTIIGSVSGSSNTANTATSALSSTNSTNSTNININDIGAGAGLFYPTFTSSTSGNGQIKIDSANLKYNGGSDILLCPNFQGDLINTNANGTIRLTSSTSQYSYFQQSNAGLGYNLNLITPNSGLFHIAVSGIADLPLANSGTGLSIGWNSTNGDGATDFINYAQGSPTGGFNFYNLNGTTNSSLIASITTAQPPLNDVSVKLATTKWVYDFVNAIPPSGLTLAQVHSSILPFTAIQTFNYDNIVNGITVGTGGGALNSNVAVGLDALSVNSSGNNNVAIGKNSLKNELGNLGQVLTITSTSPGVYTGAIVQTTTFNLIITGGGAIVDAVATCVFTCAFPGLGSYSSTIILVSGGSGYTSAPTITFPIPTGFTETNPATCSFTYNTLSGSFNTCIGANSNLNQTEGDYNTSLGYNAGSNITTGSYNTCIGNNSQVPNAINDHQIVIGTSSDTTYISGGLNITSSISPTLFTNAIPHCATSTGVNLAEITNVQYVQNLLTNLQYTYSKKANFYNVINAPTTEFFINISNPAPGGISDWGYNDFFTIRYKLSMTYPNVPIPNANPNASIYSGNIDIYPIRIPNTLIIGTSQINVINNSINGNTAYYIGTSQPTWAPNGRQMWAYNTSNYGVDPPPLYLMAVNNSIIPTISMKFILNNPNSAGANPPDPTPNIFWCDFTVELLSWGSSSPQKITTTGFTTNF